VQGARSVMKGSPGSWPGGKPIRSLQGQQKGSAFLATAL